jgi:hypothetical protein
VPRPTPPTTLGFQGSSSKRHGQDANNSTAADVCLTSVCVMCLRNLSRVATSQKKLSRSAFHALGLRVELHVRLSCVSLGTCRILLFGRRLDDMYQFHRQRGITDHHIPRRRDDEHDYIRSCFADCATAEVFVAQFSGTLILPRWKLPCTSAKQRGYRGGERQPPLPSRRLRAPER